MTTLIPTSGDFLRLFSRTPMAAATWRVAATIAGHISYDGQYRGAPKGHSAWTMAELQSETGLSERSVRDALAELARLFGLIIHRRHHQRHLFRFTGIEGTGGAGTADTEPPQDEAREAMPQGVTGNPSPVTPYSKNKINNFSQRIAIDGEGNVHRTPWVEVIRRFKAGTPAEKMDVQYLWAGFCGLNRRNGRKQVPLAWLIGFLRKYPTKPPQAPATPPKARPTPAIRPQVTADTSAIALADMARSAPFSNRQWHKSDLIRRIGQPAYDGRVAALIDLYGGGRFAAELAVHGQAVRAGEIKP